VAHLPSGHTGTVYEADHSLLESPYVVHRPEGWYLFISNRGMWQPEDNKFRTPSRTFTTVSFSRDPFDFGRGKEPWFHLLPDIHAPEIVESDGRTYIVRVRNSRNDPGARRGWLEIAPLRWEAEP
jgi:hypothetical protein